MMGGGEDEMMGGGEANREGVHSDAEAAAYVISQYPNIKYSEGKLHVYDDKTGLYSTELVALHSIIERYTHKLHTYKQTKDGEVLTAKSYGNTKSLRDATITFFHTQCRDDEFVRRTANSSLDKLLFTNGYFDGVTLYDAATHGFDPNIVFNARIPHAYEPCTPDDRAYFESVKERYFYAAIDDEPTGVFLVRNLARALMGESPKMKNVIFGMGPSNCEKTTLCQALDRACGDLVGCFDSNAMCVQRNQSGDAAQRNRWMLLHKYRRIIYAAELDPNTVLCGHQIKVVSGGGGACVARLHGGNEQPFIPHFIIFVFFK